MTEYELTIPQALEQGREAQAAGDVERARLIFRRILATEPNNARAWHCLGVLALQGGRKEEGIRLVRKAIACDGLNANFYTNLGKGLHETGKLLEAATAYRRATELNPLLPDPCYYMARLQVAQGRPAAAAHWYRRLAKLPARGDAQLRQRGQIEFDRLIEQLRRAAQENPTSAAAHDTLGVALEQRDRGEEATDHYRRAIACDPRFVRGHIHLGERFHDQGRSAEAAASYRRALAIEPDDYRTWTRLGLSSIHLKQLPEAAACFEKAMEIAPDYDEGRLARGVLSLLRGEFAAGWEGYEARLTCTGISRAKWDLPQPRWDGSSLAGKTVLLLSEQGLGDTMQFIRFAKQVKREDNQVIAEVQPNLCRLLASVEGIDELIPARSDRPPFDVHTTLPSLPGLLNIHEANLPAAVPYIRAEPQLVQAWRARLKAVVPDGGRRIGLVWRGRSAHHEDCWRSIKLKALTPLRNALEQAVFVSLQKGEGSEEVHSSGFGEAMVHFSREVDGGSDGFVDTAAIIENLDLVITIDTAVAHLAAAMGKPTWILLHWPPDWRWLLDREDSPWYPTVRLFRQEQRGDWAPVIDRVGRALQSELGR